MEFVYILHEREFINASKNVYKIGRTKQVLTRINQYPKGSHLIFCMPVNDNILVESKMITMFKKSFTQKLEFGNEYFEGDVKEMVISTIKIAHQYNMLHSNRTIKNESSKDMRVENELCELTTSTELTDKIKEIKEIEEIKETKEIKETREINDSVKSTTNEESEESEESKESKESKIMEKKSDNTSKFVARVRSNELKNDRTLSNEQKAIISKERRNAQLREAQSKFYESNKEKLKEKAREKVVCSICNCLVALSGIYRHKASTKHIKNAENITA